jgi:glycosyltransferase involved in cell wall biosynthesis
MRVLFLSPYVPSTVRIRPYSWIRTLARLGHEVRLVALRPPEDTWAPVAELKRLCTSITIIPLSRGQTLANGLCTLPTRRPLQLAYSHSPVAERYVAELVEDGGYDVVHVEHLRGVALASRLEGVPLVWDAVDSISALFAETAQRAPSLAQRWMARLDLGRTRRFEARAPLRFDRTLVTSPRDAQTFVHLAGASARDRIEVLANGVDTDHFHPDASSSRDAVLFSGKLSYHANAAAARRLVRQVMPLVWTRHPNTPVILAGKDPPEIVRRLTADRRVHVTGFMPDLGPIFARAVVAACPLVYGAGIQNKVLEAMACGVPVVTTRAAGAALAAIDERDVLLAETDAEFAEAIGRCLDDGPYRQRLGDAGRAYVEREHQWPQLGARLTAAYAVARASFRTAPGPRLETTRDTPEGSPVRPSPS